MLLLARVDHDWRPDSKDFTGGYGPEEYTVRRAMGGEYQIKANFFGSRAQQVTGPTTVQATVVTDYGRPIEQRRALTIRLRPRATWSRSARSPSRPDHEHDLK